MKTQSNDAVIRLMKQRVADLLDTSKEVQWEGTRTDLVEMVYTVYLCGEVATPDGSPATFRELLGRVYGRLGLRLPANPVAMARAARQRKGVRQRSYWDRLRQQEQGRQQPTVAPAQLHPACLTPQPQEP